jgi:predicted DNA-binding transcriptional regulator YafY
MECSRSTVIRCIEDARQHLAAPVIYNRELNGYQFDPEQKQLYELPGLWFNVSELTALMASQKLLSEVQPGLLEPYLAPFRDRLTKLLTDQQSGVQEISKRIRILQQAPRSIDIDTFRHITDALVKRKRIRILYSGRERDEITERWVSPQRLVYYRDNWYLDAWCHLRNGLRSFSLDRMHYSKSGEAAKDITDSKLDAHFQDAYGIFAGSAKHTAVIRFTASAARWVADEHWHPKQEMRVLKDGGVELRIPYSQPAELIMEILKYGQDATVTAPPALVTAIKQRLSLALGNYQ